MNDDVWTSRADLRVAALRNAVMGRLRKRGAIVQVSGGIDSAVTVNLAVKAFESSRVSALFLPDNATADESYEFAELACVSAGAPLTTVEIGKTWTSLCSENSTDEIVRKYDPAFDSSRHGYSVNFNLNESIRLGAAVYSLHVGLRQQRGDKEFRIEAADLRRLLSLQNMKQRLRMLIAYQHAEQLGYAVVGASNADELDLGFVVKHGDDAADVYAIADLQKSDVISLSVVLGVPDRIINRTPTTDTFTLAQSQDQYYYGIQVSEMRRVLSAKSVADLEDVASGVLNCSPRALWGIRNSVQAVTRYNKARIYLDESV